MRVTILHGDCRAVLPTLAEGSVQCCVTSPPYYGLRNYGVDGQIGLEPTPDEYVAEMVAVFREVRRVLRDDGTLWLNIGDSYHNLRTHNNGGAPTNTVHRGTARDGTERFGRTNRSHRLPGIKDKDLIGIPWLLAFALRADGWFLRSDIIWHKPNPMPESVRDRPTSAHEHVFLLSKRAGYFYDAGAIAEPADYPGDDRHNRTDTRKAIDAMCADGGSRARTGNPTGDTRNARNVWTIATQPYSGAHFATMPPDLAERCIKAGTKPGDMVLDPFGGAGTTGLVADRLRRNATLIELNPAYRTLAADRITADAPLFAGVA
jgi:DNA modification methylase